MDIIDKAKMAEQITVAHLRDLEGRVVRALRSELVIVTAQKWMLLAAMVAGLAGGFVLGRL